MRFLVTMILCLMIAVTVAVAVAALALWAGHSKYDYHTNLPKIKATCESNPYLVAVPQFDFDGEVNGYTCVVKHGEVK